jgi:hypothetical protein
VVNRYIPQEEWQRIERGRKPKNGAFLTRLWRICKLKKKKKKKKKPGIQTQKARRFSWTRL